MRRWRPSLKLRLMLLITVLIALYCLAAGVYIVRRAQTDIRGEVYSATELIEHYLDAQLSLAERAWRLNSESVPQMQLGQLSDVRHVDVYFYNAIGTLLESSDNDQAQAPTAPFWFVWLVQRSFSPMPDVRRFVAFDGLTIGALVIHPDPAFEIDEIWNVTRGLFALLIVFSLLVNALVWWAVGRALRPLDHIHTALNEFSAGHLDARLPAFDLPELASLSGDFNRMAATLEHSTAENHRLTRRLIQTQEDERKRIARELHDEIGQCVTAIHADAVTIHHAGGAADSVIGESATAIIEVTARIKNMLRGMLQRLHPTVIEGLGLEAALRELESAFRQRNPETTCSLKVDPDASELKGEIAIAIYRVVQEGLTNIARHAQASHVSIEIAAAPMSSTGGPGVLRVRLLDNGNGFDPNTVSEGFGLLGMRERIKGLGGAVATESSSGSGTRIAVELPWISRSGDSA
jgi:two-component system, NarL family, sensor histidine kinase UhpB